MLNVWLLIVGFLASAALGIFPETRGLAVIGMYGFAVVAALRADWRRSGRAEAA